MRNFIYLTNQIKTMKTLILGFLLFSIFSSTLIGQSCATIMNCEDVLVDLQQGECDYVFEHEFNVNDNGCTVFPFSFTQSNNSEQLDAPSNICADGDNYYYRVFDLPAMGQTTDIDISDVTIGVFESQVNTHVIVNIYSLDGTIETGNLTLLGYGNMFLPATSQQLVSVPVTATVPYDQVMVVEVVTPGSLFGGQVMASNSMGETGQSYYKSPSCGSDIIEMTGQLIMTVNGEMQPYKITQTDNSGYSIGDAFPVGTTFLTYQIIDADSLYSNCAINVTVNAYINTVTSMACNNLVQISLDDNCEGFLYADQILEGDSYSCFTDYTIHITDANGQDLGNHVSADQAGQTLAVTIESPGGNSCWGEVVVEDKYGPELECVDVYTSCAGSTDPGSDVALDVTFLTSQNASIPDGEPSQFSLAIPVGGLENATILDINLKLNIEHTDISDLKVSLRSPAGTFVSLFTAPSGTSVDPDCSHININVIMDDEAANNYADLQSSCNSEGYAIDGSYIPESSLSAFDGENPNGIWELILADLENGDGGKLIDAKLVIRQSGAKVSLPIPDDATYTKVGDFTFKVTGLDPCSKADLTFNDVVITQSCNTQYSEIIERTWTAKDENGNTSVPCIQKIYINRNDASDIVWPHSYDDFDLNHLSCDQYKDQVPGPDVTGYPSAISGELCENVLIFPYVDTRVDICEGSYKIVRYWKVVEWCTGEIFEYNQIIKVLDDHITIVCPTEEIETTEGTFTCSGFVTMPIPKVTNECSEWDYDVKWYKNIGDLVPTTEGISYDPATNRYSIVGLHEGVNVIEYTVNDVCGNQDACTVEINVKDNINPTAVCDEFTTVSIAADGEAIVKAITFDDLSTDNCGIVKYDARKMVDICSNDTKFHDELIFCCKEIGTVVMVEFRVTDGAGNKNSCMVEVTVEDKLPPYITKCPDDITLGCSEDWTDLELTGEPEYVDNCGVELSGYKDNTYFDNCGRGTIERVWTVEDAVGLKNSCVQIITIVDKNPFKKSDIRWPRNKELYSCDDSLHPDVTGYPSFDNEDACNLVAATYKDQVYSVVDSSCVKILRTWTVLDWCTYNDLDVDDPYALGIWQETQIVKLINTEAPEFVSCSDFDICAYDPCTVIPEVTIEKQATDDCTDQDDLFWTYELDLWRDGVVDESEHSNRLVNKKIPYGNHSITWIVEDKCGNSTRCKEDFSVKDCKNPTPYCLGEVVTTVMNNNGQVEIWASDFNLDSYDNCTAKEDLVFSFDGTTNPNSNRLLITCSDIPNGEEAYIPVNIWVIDEVGNKDYCEVVLLVQDNESDICGEQESALISGVVMTEDEKMIPSAMVAYQGEVSEIIGEMMTSTNGYYNFDVGMNSDYSMSVEKNDDPMNGVSTLDLLLIQRHILKLKEFDSPYKIIAADIDDNSKINAYDLIQLRRLILGKIQTFPAPQKEWRFVDEEYEFLDPTSPFPFQESIQVSNLVSNMNYQDFIGVKIGDVNNDISLNAQSGNSVDRDDISLSLYTEMIDFLEGTEVRVPIKASDLVTVSGMQFTIGLNTSIVSYEGFMSGVLDVSNENFGLSMLDRGHISFSWSDINTLDLKEDDVLFTLVFNSSNSGNVNDIISINSDVTLAEGYTKGLETIKIDFGVRLIGHQSEAVLYQNTPNPFEEKTSISFYLPNASNVNLTVYDIGGRVVKNIKKYFSAGMSTVSINLDNTNESGLLYYQIETNDFTATKKMIVLK